MGNWLGQITTGLGASGAVTTLAAMATGAMTWQHAVPLLVGSAISLFWPEQKG